MDLLACTQSLSDAVEKLTFSEPVTHVYNPLVYAWEAHRRYLECYGTGTKEVVLVGMNPGPWGMAQTGVPFGEVGAVRDWMGIEAKVSKPNREHPKRPVEGFSCTRSEVSGRRLWGWAADRFGTAEAFFERFFVLNHCPLCFMEESGRNRTPDKLAVDERQPLEARCDEALRQSIEILKPRMVIGVGAHARKRAEVACAGMALSFGQILHPSPASPAANRGWADQAEAQLKDLGIHIP